MSDQHHIIQKQAFDISFASREKAFTLQGRISSLFHAQLEQVIEHIFDRLIPADTVVKFDALQVDIGRIHLDRLEEEFAEKLGIALEKELGDRLRQAGNTGNISDENTRFSAFKAGYLDLLEYFLITGGLPWWAAGENMTDPAKALELVLKENAGAFKRLLKRAGQSAYVRRRIVYQFSEESVRAIVAILEPEEAGFIFEYHREIIKEQQEKAIVKDEINELKKAVWGFILTYLLVDRGNNFNRKDFIKSTLGQMAQHFNLRYEALLELFGLPLLNQNEGMIRGSSLADLIKELLREALPADQPEEIFKKRKEVKKSAEDVWKMAELIRYYLAFGALPYGADQYEAGDLSVIFSELINGMPETVKRLILPACDSAAIAERIAVTFDISVITGIIRITAASDAGFIISFLDSIGTLHQKKPFVNVGSREFGIFMAASVLTLLLVEKAVFFDAPRFLENNIRRMALRYNLGFTELLGYIIQGMGETYSASPDTSFFHLLTGLLQEQKKAVGTRDPFPDKVNTGIPGGQRAIGGPGKVRAGYRRDQEYPLVEAPQRGGVAGANAAGYGKFQGHQLEERRGIEGAEWLRDILRYWLEQGYFPWWGAQYSPDSPEGLWTKIMAQKPEEVIWLVKYAGREVRIKQRLIYQMPLHLLLATFRLFPEGNEAVALYEFMVHLLESREEPGLNLKNVSVRQNLLMLALWDAFIASGYRTFDTDIFVARIAFQLSQWTGLYAESIYRSLLKIIVEDGGKVYPERLIRSVRSAYEEGKGTTGEIMKGWTLAEEGANIRLVIGQYLFPGKAYRNEDILRESERILEYYLTWNKLPDRFPGMTPVMTDIFLKRLLQLLAGERYVRLKAILEQETHLSAARMRLHDLFFADSPGTDKNIKMLLEEFRQKDLLRYVAERSGMQQPISDEKFKEILDYAISHPFRQKEKGFLQVLLSSPAIARQVAERYGEDIVYDLIEHLGAGWGRETIPFLRQVQSMMVSAIPDKWEREKISGLFRQFNLLFLAGEKGVRNQTEYLRLLLPRLADASSPVAIKIGWYKSLLTLDLSPDIRRQLKEWIEKEALHIRLMKDIAKPDSVKYKKELGNITKELALARQKEEEKARAVVKKPLKEDEATNYIRNAGLVLLHPFLSTYFSRLELTEKGKFVNEEAQFRAIHLLQYLVDGTALHQEHELVLNKILCGLPVEEPIPLEILISEKEKAVSLELLQVVLQQWEKLKNTSIEGLRASFLQRQGALTPMDDAWKLRVEQRGYDILLQTLPWSVGMIKASWMKKILYVEWT